MSSRFDDRFTERARKALMLSQEEAARMQHAHIGTEHLLLGLLREGSGVAARVLIGCGADPHQVRQAIEERVGKLRSTPAGRTAGLTPRMKRVIEFAVEEARRMGHHYIGTEHLLLGLLRVGNGLGIDVLREQAVDLDAVRIAVTHAILQQADPRQRERADVWAFERRASRPPTKCLGCDKPLQMGWNYCPFCGTLTPGKCPQCHMPLPEHEDVRYCPQCGSQV